jgi:hypothetical protein
MSGYHFTCPACDCDQPVSPNDLDRHSARPDRVCQECFDEGCTLCMPNEMCDDCADRLDDLDHDCDFDYLDDEDGEDDFCDPCGGPCGYDG